MPTSTGTYDTSTITYDQSSLSYDGFPAPLSNMPAVGVFVAFAGQPYEVNPAFTEISQYVRQVTIRRGRQDDLQQFPPGTAQLVLDNRDRLFDPFNDGRLATRTNLVPNPSFETDVSGWIVASVALARITTDAVSGSACMQVTSLSASAVDARTAYDPNTTAVAGETFTASAYMKNTAGNNREHRVYLRFFNSGGTIISSSFGSATLTVGGVWTRISVTATAPANTASVDVAIYTQATNPSLSNVTLLDAVLLEKSASLGTYFDGSSTDGSWTGVPNNSTSQLKVYRRNLIPNPSFETGTTSWSATGSAPGSIAQNTFFEVYGDYSCLRSVIGDGVAYVQTSIAGNIPISAGVAYTLSAYCRTSISRNVRVIIQWRDSANTFISNAVGVLSASSTTAFTRFTVTGTAPANAVSAVAFLETNNAFIGDVIYWDAVMLEQSSSVGDYFDGSLAGAFNFGTPQWEGTANASTSVMRKFPLPSQLSPRDQIKIVANWNGVEYPLYRGYVAGWPVEYTEAGLDSTVTIDCFDLIGLVANEVVPFDWPDFYMRQTQPYAYWKFSDPIASAQTKEEIGTTTWSLYSIGYTAAAILRQGQPASETTPGGSTYFQDYAFAPAWGENPLNAPADVQNVTNISFAGWLWNSAGDNAFITLNWGPPISVQISSAGVLSVSLRTGGPGGFQYTTYGFSAGTRRWNPSIPTHFVVQVAKTGSAWDTISSVIINGETISGTVTSSVSSGLLIFNTFLNPGQGSFQEVAFWQRALTSAEALQLSRVNYNNLVETTTNRINRISNFTSVSNALESFDTSTINVSSIGEIRDVATAFNVVTDSEGGEFFVSSSGVLNFFDRDFYAERTRSNTSQVTFTDTGVGVDYDASSIRMDFNADQVRNNIKVEYSGGGVVTVNDSTSVATYGAAEMSVGTLLDSVDSASTLANRMLTIYKNPKMTVEPFMSKGQADPAYNWPRLLGLELLDRVTFKRTPAIGSAIVKDLLVQSIEHRITPGEWQTVVNGSARYTNWFIVGVSLIGGDDLLLN